MGEMLVKRVKQKAGVAGGLKPQQSERTAIMRRKIDAQIRNLHLPDAAKDLWRMYKLDTLPISKSFLRHEMQRGLLLKIREKRAEEFRALSLLNAATTIEHTLRQSKSPKIPLSKAIVVHEAALLIAETALKNCRKKRFAAIQITWIQRLNKDLKEMKNTFGKQPNSEIKADFERLHLITKDVDGLIDAIMPRKGAFVKKGFDEIDGIVKWAFSTKERLKRDYPT